MMRYLAAYMLAQIGGNNRPGEEEIKTILSSVGIECEQERVKMLLNSMHGHNVHDLILAGKEKMSTVAIGAVSAAGAPAAAAPAQAASAAAPAAAKVEEKKEESEESDADMGFGLFD